MRLSVVALLSIVAVAYAQDVASIDTDAVEVDAENDAIAEADLFAEPFAFPEGVAKPKKKFLPKKDNKPPKGEHKPIWHPGHKGAPIDDCDDDDDKWHWAGAKKKHPVKPIVPHWKWTTTVIKVTKTYLVPGGHKTIKEKDEPTPCPVPITKPSVPHPPKPTPDHPKPPPKPEGPGKPDVTKPAPPPSPPKPTGNVSSPPPAPTRVVVTGAAPQNVQRTGGALAAVAAVIAALF